MALRFASVYILAMRIFWHEGGLHIHPENEHEGRMLVEIVDHLKFEKPQEMQAIGISGSSSGYQELTDRLIGNHQIPPGCLASDAENKQPVVPINKRR